MDGFKITEEEIEKKFYHLQAINDIRDTEFNIMQDLRREGATWAMGICQIQESGLKEREGKEHISPKQQMEDAMNKDQTRTQ